MSNLHRNYKIVSLALLFGVLFSCSTSVNIESETLIKPEPTAKDIVISELLDPCQCIDAMLLTVNEINDLQIINDSVLNEQQNLVKIQKQIEGQCIDTMHFTKRECANCANFSSLETAFDSIPLNIEL